MMWSAFILGFLGSLHCAAMCGPLMLGLAAREYSLFSHIVHHVGRWLGYAALALFFYFLISPLQVFKLQQYVGLVSGILLVLYALKSYIRPVNALIEFLSKKVTNWMTKINPGRTGSISLGFLNGLLPCGLSFGAAILSVNAGSAVNAMLYMILFGIGTLPILLAISYLPRFGKGNIIQKLNRHTPKLLLIVGLVLIVRSAGLGIPYLSPDYNIEEEKMECCEPT
ncbi:MAG: sulfite exporter TauE/SafE family protein [Bacteroidia bacterium]|nr:sulfite exporter TauE/SafE family protein [Bacteroidia bacterium]NNJ55924.1 sulfite exporter TauE/SafE family protein [Bacteroidia bacterium]